MVCSDPQICNISWNKTFAVPPALPLLLRMAAIFGSHLDDSQKPLALSYVGLLWGDCIMGSWSSTVNQCKDEFIAECGGGRWRQAEEVVTGGVAWKPLHPFLLSWSLYFLSAATLLSCKVPLLHYPALEPISDGLKPLQTVRSEDFENKLLIIVVGLRYWVLVKRR